MKADIGSQIRSLVENRAPAIMMAELTELVSSPRRAVGQHDGPLVPPPGRHVHARMIVAAGCVAAVAAAAAAAAAIVTAQVGGSAGRPTTTVGAGHGAKHHQPGTKPAMLTAATVERIVRESQVAMAKAGHVWLSYSNVTGGFHNGSGTLDLTFSGDNYNAVSQQPGAAPFTSRVVDGQVYTYGDPAPGRPLQWYHSINEHDGGQTMPDPRKLLTSIAPTAGFESLGWQDINGMRLQHLRATNVSGLSTALLTLNNGFNPVSALDVWANARGVIIQLAVTCKGTTHQDLTDVETFSIRFLDIGEPESVMTPAHYANMVTHG